MKREKGEKKEVEWEDENVDEADDCENMEYALPLRLNERQSAEITPNTSFMAKRRSWPWYRGGDRGHSEETDNCDSSNSSSSRSNSRKKNRLVEWTLHIAFISLAFVIVYVCWNVSMGSITRLNTYRDAHKLYTERKEVGTRYKHYHHCTSDMDRYMHEKHDLRDCARAEIYADLDPDQEARRVVWESTRWYRFTVAISDAFDTVIEHSTVMLIVVMCAVSFALVMASYQTICSIVTIVCNRVLNSVSIIHDETGRQKNGGGGNYGWNKQT